MQDFRKLQVWHRSHDLTLRLYELTSQFPREEVYGLTNQIRRACASDKHRRGLMLTAFLRNIRAAS